MKMKLKHLTSLFFLFTTSCISTKYINLSDKNTLFNNQRSLDIRELEAIRILNLNINRIKLRSEDITRLQNLLENNTFFVPLKPKEPVSYNTDELPSLGKIEYTPSITTSQIPVSPTNLKQEEQVHALELQAVIRLLSRDFSSRTFLLVLEQLVHPATNDPPAEDIYLPVRNEAINYIMQTDGSYSRYVWEIMQSGRLSSEVRIKLVPIFLELKMGTAYLMALLQDTDPLIVDAVVQNLIIIYPSYTNPQLTNLIEDPYNRHLAAPWLFAYQSQNAFNAGLRLVEDVDPRVQKEAKQALLHTNSTWLISQATITLQKPLSSNIRLLLVEYIARRNSPSALNYIHELLLHDNPIIREYAHSYILNAGSSYYPFLIKNIENSYNNLELLSTLLPYTMNFLNVTTAKILIPLLNHENEDIRHLLQTFFTKTVSQKKIQELLLDAYLNNLIPTIGTLFIMDLFISNHLTSLVTFQKTSPLPVNKDSLIFILKSTSESIWSNFILQVRPISLQVFLHRTLELYSLLLRSQAYSIDNPMINISKQATQLNTLIQGEKIKQIDSFLNLIENPNSKLEYNNELIHQRNSLNKRIKELYDNSPATQKEEFTNYQHTIEKINITLSSIRPDYRSIIDTMLDQFNFSLAWIQAFQSVPLI